VLFANRAAALLKLNRPAKASESCEKAVLHGSRDPKVYIRWSQSLMQIGRFEQAAKVLETPPTKELVSVLFPYYRKASQLHQAWEVSGKEIEKGEYDQAKVLLTQLLQDPSCRKYSRVISRAALAEAHIGNVDLALRLSLEAARTSPEDEQAWIARAHALVSNGQFDEARQSAKQALRLNPDDEFAKSCNRYCKFVETQVQTARNASDKHDWETARKLFLELVMGAVLPKKSPLRVQLLAERAHASYCAGLYQEALTDANQAIYQQDDCQRAWLTRFYCLRELGKHEEAVKDARELLQRWGANDIHIRSAAENAEFELRKSKRPDLYGVLGVSSLASELEIKQAYKQKALVFHPDKMAPTSSEAERKRCEETFKLMGIALEVLGNHEKRELYDKGFDMQGIQEELERRRRRSHH
jgi:tetratricopeptide (TPR) repeat protein